MRTWLRGRKHDLLTAPALLFILPLLLLAPVTLGSRTLLPVDNLIGFEPWASRAQEFGLAPPHDPHNELLSDLILENYVWKRFILQSIQAGEIPLWNPYIFAGAPFLGAGQHSAMYPFSVLFYVLPLAKAYGWFTLSQYFLGGVLAFVFIRALGAGRLGALLGGVIYQLSLFMVVSAVFPMIVAGAVWLPLFLTAIELVIRQHPALGDRPASLPWMFVGAVAFGMTLLAGHPEVVAYTALVGAGYSVWRLATEAATQPVTWRGLLRPLMFLLAMVALGAGLGAVQFVPLADLIPGNFRAGAATLAQVRAWGYPWRRILAFVVPNFFGNPSHHAYLDLFTWRWTPVSFDASGHPIQRIDWGMKNYVEGGAYVGILPLLLALLGTWGYVRGRLRGPSTVRLDVRSRSTPFFAALGFLCLAFAFGTPLYALIYYLPGMNQLHSPFRWVWPFSLCVAVLAAWGVRYLQQTHPHPLAPPPPPGEEGLRDNPDKPLPASGEGLGWGGSTVAPFVLWSRVSIVTVLAGLAFWGGALLLAALVLARVFYDRLAGLFDRAVADLALASGAFSGGRMFFSYEARWIGLAALFLIGAGVVLRVSRCPIYLPAFLGRRPVWELLAVGVVALDLLVAGAGFNSSSDPALLDYVPPVVAFLKSDASYWRFTTYDPDGRKPFNANSGWLFDLQDVRGYDSIIPSQYARYMALIQPQGELQFNRIAPIDNPQSLDSPLLDLLNVKYVLSSHPIQSPKYTLVYDEDLLVYRNEGVAPRAFTLPAGCAFTGEFASAVQTYDPRHYVILDQAAASTGGELRSSPSRPSEECAPSPASISLSEFNTVMVDVSAAEPAYLLLADSYAPGWRAYVRPFGADESAEKRVDVLRANGNFRAVYLEPGDHSVRFRYSPDAFKLGGFVTAMAVMSLAFVIGTWLWRYFYRESAVDSTARRVAKNSLAPMALNLLNRLIDFVFAAFYLRVLGPGEAGNYTTAIVLIGWFDIWTNFGLNTWLTREAARDRSGASKYLSNTTIFRLALGGLTFPLFVGGIVFYQHSTGALGDDTVLAIGLLAIGMLFSSISNGLSALFYAYEQAEYPAAITSVTTIMKVSFGAIALLLGYGFVGLAGSTILVNLLTMLILLALVWRLYFRPGLHLDLNMQRNMAHESFPLMINHLLATLFFKIDVPLIRTMRGDAEVGRYGAAYKFVDAFNVIPSFFTLALFPVMSRQAAKDRGELQRTYYLALKLLVGVALPLAVLSTALATPLIGMLGGREFLPDGARALQLMVWSIPFGWINSVTNYLLISVDQQRALTRAFVVGLVFNVAVNVVFIPRFGFQAAAISTIFSEIVEGAAFQVYVYRHVGRVPWSRIFWRLGVAAALMIALLWLGGQVHVLLGLLVGGLAYAACIVGFKVFDADERELLSGILPSTLRLRTEAIAARFRLASRG